MSQYVERTSLLEKKEEIEEHRYIPDQMITNRTDLLVFNALKEHQPATRMDLCDKTVYFPSEFRYTLSLSPVLSKQLPHLFWAISVPDKRTNIP